MDAREELRLMIQKRCLNFGSFTLASGRKSDYLVDGKQITLDGKGLRITAELILEILDPNVEAIGGMSLGADPITGAVIALSDMHDRHLSGFLVRKEKKDHGSNRQIEGPLEDKTKIAILEDVATTGQSILQTITALKREFDKIEIVQIIVIVDRLEGATENLAAQGYPLQSIFTINEFDLSKKPE